MELDRPPILPTSDGHHDRADLVMLKRALRWWKIPEEWTDNLPQVAAMIAADSTRPLRDRLRALELIATLVRDNVSLMQVMDKMRRLDSGEATERVDSSVRIVVE